jgi:hypothetical protein
MKKLSAFLAVSLTSLVFGISFGVLEANHATPLFAGDVAPTSLSASTYLSASDATSSFTTDGVITSVPGQDSKGSNAWSYKARMPGASGTYLSPCFNINNNRVVSFRFSAGYYASDGTELSHSVNGYALDVYMYNAANDAQLAMVRIWANAGSYNNGNHSCVLYGSDWTSYDGAGWIDGDAMLSSSFYLQFDKTNLFESYINKWGTINPLVSSAYKTDKAASFADVDQVYFAIGGDGGFSASTSILIREINGQSLAQSSNVISDTLAPTWNDESVASSVNAGVSYSIPLTASDVMGAPSYSVTYNSVTTSGSSFTPTGSGSQSVIYTASDAAGNSVVKSLTFNVVSSSEQKTSFVSQFNTALDATCSNTAPTAIPVTTWNDLASAYASLSSEAKTALKNVDVLTEIDVATKQALNRYDYVMGKTSYASFADFMGRFPERVVPAASFVGASEQPDLFALALLGCAVLLASLGFFFLHNKKKHA